MIQYFRTEVNPVRQIIQAGQQKLLTKILVSFSFRGSTCSSDQLFRFSYTKLYPNRTADAATNQFINENSLRPLPHRYINDSQCDFVKNVKLGGDLG